MCDFTIPGFDEDIQAGARYHLGRSTSPFLSEGLRGVIRQSIAESDAAHPVLTDAERAELAEYDRWVAHLAATEAPLDGCEDDAPDWHGISAPGDTGEVATLLEGAPMAMTATW